MGIAIKGAAEASRKLGRLPADIQAAKVAAVRRSSILGHGFVVARMNDQPGRDPFLGKLAGRGGSITTRTGHTRSAITPGGVVAVAGDRVSSAVGSPDKHMRPIEEGGVVPEGSRIPLAAAQTPGGRDRFLGVRMTSAVLKQLGMFRYPTKAQRAGKGKKSGAPWPEATYIVKALGKGAGSRLAFWYMYLARATRIRPRWIFRDGAAKVNQTARRDLDGLVHAVAVKANR